MSINFDHLLREKDNMKTEHEILVRKRTIRIGSTINSCNFVMVSLSNFFCHVDMECTDSTLCL